MTERQANTGRRDRGRGPGPDAREGGTGPNARNEPRRDPGAYIGRMPERATQTIPGGLGPKDQRVSAVATQPEPVRGPDPSSDRGAPPEGHREVAKANDETLREAGQNR
jgi:hypothetical protein